MSILLLGPHGQVGQAMRQALPGSDLLALDRQGRDGLKGDLEDPAALARAIRSLRPRVIVNAAAYTAVDHAEGERARAFAINAQAPGVIAEAARQVGARLIHYSTDYVFDGTGDRPWREDDPTGPVNAYGESKLAGEEAIRAALDDHLILRVSWVHHPRGRNFIRTILELAAQRERLTVVADQWGAPTPATLIAEITRAALERPELTGTYHLAPAGETTWHGIARLAVAEGRRCGLPLRLDPQAIEAIPSEAYPTPAPRPKNSRLDTRALQAALGRDLPPWEAGVRQTVRAIAQNHEPTTQQTIHAP